MASKATNKAWPVGTLYRKKGTAAPDPDIVYAVVSPPPDAWGGKIPDNVVFGRPRGTIGWANWDYIENLVAVTGGDLTPRTDLGFPVGTRCQLIGHPAVYRIVAVPQWAIEYKQHKPDRLWMVPEKDPDSRARWTTAKLLVRCAHPDTFEDTTMTTETINKLIEIQQGVLTDTTKSAAERTAAVHEIERLKDTRDHPLVEPTLRERMVKLAQESVAIAKEAGAGADVEGAIFQRLLTGNR
jgi:hypothetical protein